MSTMGLDKKDKIKNLISNPFLYVLSVLLVLVVYFLKAYAQVPNLDYIPINGTFQNYNIIRRFLDGQIPFVDFPAYLGMGHLVVTSFFTLLFGGDYAASVIAYHFVSSLSVVIYCYALSFVFFKRNWVIPSFLAVLFRIVLYPLLDPLFLGGNSARSIRALVIPISILIYVIVSAFIESRKDVSENKKFYYHLILLSVISGMAFVWSNDYGLVCFIAIILLVPLLVLVKKKSIWKMLISVAVVIFGTMIIAALLVLIVSRGHFNDWFRSNFFSSQYQSWYFEAPKYHATYLYQLDLSFPVIVCILMLLAHLVIVIRKLTWENIRRFGTIAFAMLSFFGACEAYRLFSLRDKAYGLILLGTEVIVLVFELIFFVIRCLKKNDKKLNRKMEMVLFIVPASFVIVGLVISLFGLKRDKSSLKYYPELGGYLNCCSEDLDRSLELVGDRKVFSEYASSLEVATDQYQPSGYDYIIHVLTDDTRKEYLRAFSEKDFDVASTIRVDYAMYGKWLRMANWYFYRELYSDWHFIGCNSYADYWEYGEEPDSVYTGEIKTDVYRVSDSQVYVLVGTEDKTINGIADVCIDYEANVKEDASKLFILRVIVGATDTNASGDQLNQWCLRQKNKEYIPVEIVDGFGYVILDSYPVDKTTIEVNELSCDRIFLLTDNDIGRG